MKNRIKLVTHISLLIISLSVVSCGVPSQLSRKNINALPENYGKEMAADTSTVATLQYRDYFRDSFLVDLIDDVVENNIDNRIAGHQVEIAEAMLLARKGVLLPEVNAVIRASGTRYGKHTIEGVGNFDTNLSPNIEKSQQVNTTFTPNYLLGLEASWEIDLWGKLGQMKKAARNRYLASVEGRNLLRAGIVTQTAALYYELIVLDRELKILEENLRLQNNALEIVKVQKEVGHATELAVQQFNAALLNTGALLSEVRQSIVETENQLISLRGKYNETIKRDTTIGEQSMEYLANHGRPQQLLTLRPDIRQRFLELEASEADAKAARAAFFPRLALSAYGGINAFNTVQLFNPTSAVAQLLGNITAPVFQRNQLKANFKIATASQEIAFLEYQQAVIRGYQETSTLLSYLSNTENIIELKRKEVASLAKGVDVANDLYLSGYANYLEIIAAQKSKLAAEMDLVKAERNRARATIHLYKALGGGWR